MGRRVTSCTSRGGLDAADDVLFIRRRSVVVGAAADAVPAGAAIEGVEPPAAVEAVVAGAADEGGVAVAPEDRQGHGPGLRHGADPVGRGDRDAVVAAAAVDD